MSLAPNGYVPAHLARCFLTVKTSDVLFITRDGDSFPAHSVIIENASQTFMNKPRKMGLLPSPFLPVKIQTPYHHDVIELFLEFLYHGQINDFVPFKGNDAAEQLERVADSVHCYIGPSVTSSSMIDHHAYDLSTWVEAAFAAKSFDVPAFGDAIYEYLSLYICDLVQFDAIETVDALDLIYNRPEKGPYLNIFPLLLKGIVNQFDLLKENRDFREFAEENGRFSWDLSQAMSQRIAAATESR
ncbi:hypothetical protein BROUX41_002534 [Berkeleyomyces rouxiae]